jgi:hypothetical protein
MNDLKLSEDHDLVIAQGDLSLLNSEASVAKQTLKINLLMYQGEWFLDNTIGVPYFQEIFGKVTNTTLADNIIQEIARDSYNISRITGFSSQITADRTYVVDRLDAITEEGEIISVSNLQI